MCVGCNVATEGETMSEYTPELPKIDPCPFCNAKAGEKDGPELLPQWSYESVPQSTGRYFVRCGSCGGTGPVSEPMTKMDHDIGYTPEYQAISKWNRRGEVTELAMEAGREVYRLVKAAIQAAYDKAK
jgi:transcription elongation factor Elf1